ncbi:hypothetical protein ABPG77_002904 [Micractinium sp. CCAP 211/92]
MHSQASCAQPGLGPAPSSVALPPRGSPAVGPADAPHLHELQGSADRSFHPEAPEPGRAACSRQREVTPDAEPAQRGQGGNRGGQDHRGDVPLPGPITPDAATGHALCLSPVAEAAATGEGQQGGRASLPAAAEGAPLGTLTPGAADSALRSFVRCVEAAPLLQSALLWMELNDRHPLPEGAHKGPAARGRDLQLTLAQLLALHLRSGTPKATEASLLASLWVLESAQSCHRSPATVCLASYVKYLGLLAPQLVERLTADWPAAFAQLRERLVAAQAELLSRLGWRVRLDYQADVLPCAVLLFGPPPAACAASPPAPAPGGSALGLQPCRGQEHSSCAAAIRRLAAQLVSKAHALQQAECLAAACQGKDSTPPPEERPAACSPAPLAHAAAGQGVPSKRRRVR